MPKTINVGRDLSRAVDLCVTALAELSYEQVCEISAILERGLVHSLIEQKLRESEGVSHLRPVG